MALSEHQKEVIALLMKSENKTVTHSDVCEIISYYNNTSKYVSEILSRMVKQGYLIRMKKGLFCLGNGFKKTNLYVNPNQEQLF